eukprot:scaffold7.g3472.t1
MATAPGSAVASRVADPQAGNRHAAAVAWVPRRQEQQQQRRRHVQRVRAQQQGGGDLGDTLRRAAKQVQASLPIVGLLSRLAAPEGGVGSDMIAYPEYCRSVYEAAPEGFQIAVAELQDRFGRPCQRRYVLCITWMCQLGAGLLPAKDIVSAARRLRVSFDLEYETDRFADAFQEERKKYTFIEVPRPPPVAQAALAVDALARLCLGLKDGEPLEPEEAELIATTVVGGLFGVPGIDRAVVDAAIATRQERASAYA